MEYYVSISHRVRMDKNKQKSSVTLCMEELLSIKDETETHTVSKAF